VFINGTNLGTATSISFHGVAASSFLVVSATKLQVVVPAGATTGPVSVVNPDGTATSASDFTVVTAPAPVVTSFSPAKGTIGTKVTITGTNFTGATAVRFGGVITTPTSVTATKLTAVVPAGALSGAIQVNTPGGPGASAGWFWLTPSIASFTPAGGIAGTHVTITGAGFTGATVVKFNGLSVSTFTIVDDHTITATVAPGTASGVVSVTTPAGTAASKDRFTDYRIASLTPAKGDVGTHITLVGTGFTGTTAVAVNGTSAASFIVSGDTKITAVVAAGTTTGPITVATPHGTLTTSASFWMIPHVASFSPAQATAGSTVTITGSGLTGTTAVKFNTTAVTSFTVVSDTQITATIAAKTTSGFVSVTTPGGTAKSAQALVVATVTSFSATRGVPGAKVTITGVGFTGATAVKFGGASAVFTVVSDSKITAFVPIGAATGPLTVATTAGLATSTTVFTVV
jgi:hypothetical protein